MTLLIPLEEWGWQLPFCRRRYRILVSLFSPSFNIDDIRYQRSSFILLIELVVRRVHIKVRRTEYVHIISSYVWNLRLYRFNLS